MRGTRPKSSYRCGFPISCWQAHLFFFCMYKNRPRESQSNRFFLSFYLISFFFSNLENFARPYFRIQTFSVVIISGGGGGAACVCTSCVAKLSYLACELISVLAFCDSTEFWVWSDTRQSAKTLVIIHTRHQKCFADLPIEIIKKKMPKKSLGWDFNCKQDVWDVI